MMSSGWHVPRIAAGMISLVMLISGGAAMQIDSCTTITVPGEYKLNRSLDNVSSCIGITSDNVILDGAGYAIEGQGSGDGVAVLGSTALRNVTVKNMTVTGWENGIVFNNVREGSITDINASSNSRYGIKLYSSSNNNLTGNNASSNSWTGIHLESSGTNTLTGNVANSNGDNGFSLLYDSGGNTLENNTASSNSNNGIHFDTSGDNTLDNNTVDLNDNHGIYLYTSDNNTLINNRASLNSNTGIYFLYSNDNTVTGSTAGSNGENGIYLDFSGMNTLIGNTVSSNINGGIKVLSSNHNILTNNTISNSSDGIAVDEIIDGSSSGNSIISNRIYNTKDHGIILIRSFNSVIKGNNVSFNSGEGILFLQGSWNNTISNNTASSNGQCGGICLLNSSGNILTNNTANSNTIGISLGSSGGNVLNNNIADSNDNYGIHVSGMAASYTVPEVPFRFVNVNTSTASTINYVNYISDRGNHIMQMDNSYFIYELPFTFPFMGRNITKISVNTNGLIQLLESGEDCYECDGYETHYSGDHIGEMDAIFASYDDLTMEDSANTYLGVFNLQDKVVIEWYGLTHADKRFYGYDSSSNPVHFQVVMYPDGLIEWNFKTMNFIGYELDMFTGVYAEGEDIEVVGGYAINTRKSLAINLSTTLPAPEYNTIRDNRISNNNPGIFLESSSNTIYNNYFNNTNNAADSGSNTWNISRTIGSNIADGPYLGGNFWAHPNGTGFSQVCADTNRDGICDSPCVHNSNSIDHLPLALFLRKTSTSITVNTDVNANRTIEIDPDESRNITNSVIELNAMINAPVILRINASTDARALNATPAAPAYGLGWNEQITGRYIQVNVTGIDTGSLNFVNLTAYYTASDLDKNGDGDTDDPEDLNERTLRVYWFNPNATADSERWKPLGPGIEPRPDYTSLGGPRVIGSDRNITARYLKVTLNHFSTFALAAEITLVQYPPGGSSGSGGGGGGGGLITSEPFDNIAKAENLEKNLIADRPVTYTFTRPGTYEVDVTGKENESDVALRVEVLRGTSKLVSVPPPGAVYKNVNIWAGTKKVKVAVIRFRIENSWLDSNNLEGDDVRMLKWNAGRWVQLDTAELRKDASYTYFESRTDTFSHFAISGLKGELVESNTSNVLYITPAAGGSPGTTGISSEVAPPVNLALIAGALVIAVMAALYFRKK